MEKLLSIAISQAALRLLPGYDGFSGDVAPPDWFNWIGTKGHGGDSYNVRRIQIMPQGSGMAELLRWNRNAFSAGYGTQFICCTDDGFLKIQELVDVDPDLDLYVLDRHPEQVDPDEFGDLLAALREPDAFFRAGWQAIRWSGGRPLATHSKVTPDQWHAYGDELRRWYNEGWEENASSGPDLRVWHSDQKLQPYHFGAFLEPLVNFGGFAKFFQCVYMPCCGIGVRRDGTLGTVGMIMDELDEGGNWVWDRAGAIRAFLSREATKVNENVGTFLRLIRAEVISNSGAQPRQGEAFADNRSRSNKEKRPTGLKRNQLELTWAQGGVVGEVEFSLISNSAEVELRIRKPDMMTLPEGFTKVTQTWNGKTDEWRIQRIDQRYVVDMGREVLFGMVSNFKDGASTSKQAFEKSGVKVC